MSKVQHSQVWGSAVPLQEAYDVALVDLDGVAYRGPHAIPSAPAALAAARAGGMGVVFVTNNASREPGAVAEHLSSLGIPTAEHEVLTAAQAIAALMAETLEPGATVMVVGGLGLRTAVEGAGFSLVEAAQDRPDAVVQGFSPDVSWRELAEASYAISDGARFFASNLDLTIPNDRGTAPGNGALVNVVVTATGVTPPAAGKPEPAMFRLAATQASASRPIAVGDRLDTDIKGARAAGYPSLLVLTGVDGIVEALMAPPAHRPSYLGRDLTALASTHAAPVREGDSWRVNGATARVASGTLTVEPGPVSGESDGLDWARAACAAVWEATDRGDEVTVESIREVGVVSDHG